MRQIILGQALCVLVFLSSCGPNYEIEDESKQAVKDKRALIDDRQGQDALLFYGTDEWPISCYFYDPKSKEYGQSLPLWNRAWEWAKTPDGALIHAKGRLEGGFLVADGIYYSKGRKVGSEYINLPGAEQMPVQTGNQLAKLCQESIDRAHPNKGYKLISMVGSRNTLAVTNLIDNAFPLVVGEKANQNKITRMVIFGDSLSDTGRLKKRLQFMPGAPFFLGRFTNGGNWTDFLGHMTSVSILNHSIGGAVTKANVTTPINAILSYVKDVGRFFVTGSIKNFMDDYIKNEISGRIPEPDRTLFVVWGGANDFMSKFDRKSDIDTLIDRPDVPGLGGNDLTEQTVLNITQDVKNLIALGAKNIVVVNLPDIGKTPRMAENNHFRSGSDADKYAFAESMSTIIRNYNDALQRKVTELQGRHPDIKLLVFDSESALNKLMHGIGPNGEANFDYGIDMKASFTTLSAPSKPDIRVGVKCYKAGYLGSLDQNDVCPNASEMLFWDEVHPTAIGHCGIAYFMHDTLHKAGFVSTPAVFEQYRQMCK